MEAGMPQLVRVAFRHDFKPGPHLRRPGGGQGMAPCWFEVDATAYVSEDIDVTSFVVGVKVWFSRPRLKHRAALDRIQSSVGAEKQPS